VFDQEERKERKERKREKENEKERIINSIGNDKQE